MKSRSLDRIGFAVSLAALAMMYGYLANTLGWFPARYLNQALEQASYVLLTDEMYLYPRVHRPSGTRTPAPKETEPGLTLISSRWEESDWDPSLRLIDPRGNVVHEWYVDPDWFTVELGANRPMGVRRDADQRPVHGVHLFPDGDMLFNLEYLGTARIDACSRVEWQIDGGGHHSIDEADDGTFWIPGSTLHLHSSTPAHPDGLPGLDRPVYMDRLLRVSPHGEVLETKNLLDVLYANGLQRYVFKAKMTDTTDVTHLNDIEPLESSRAATFPGFEAGDLLLSIRNLDLVAVVDPQTWKVKWHAANPFLAQHDPDFLDDGWIGVFDNNRDGTLRGSVLGGSRIVALRPSSDSMRILFPTARSDTFYTGIMGKWQRLRNGNLLLTEARAGRILEVAGDGQTVWEWVNAPYDEASVPEVMEGIRYDITPEQVAAWPCSPDERRSGPSQREPGKTRSGG